MHAHRPSKESAAARALHHVSDVLRHLSTLIVIAVPLNYAWELGQSPLYLSPGPGVSIAWHCLVASLGDGVLVSIIYAAGVLVCAERDWYVRMNIARYVVMLASGFALSILVEHAALQAQRWTYTDIMPLIPGIKVGVVPILQMLALPPFIFLLAKVCAARLDRR